MWEWLTELEDLEPDGTLDIAGANMLNLPRAVRMSDAMPLLAVQKTSKPSGLPSGLRPLSVAV